MIQTAKRTLRKMIKGQKGQALPIVLVLLVIGGLLIVPTLRYASTSLKGHQVTEKKAKELYAADSGVEDGIYWLIRGKDTGGPWNWDEDVGYGERGTYDLNDRYVDVTVKRMDEMGPNIYKITSIATTSPSGNTTVLSTVWAVYSSDDFPVEHNELFYGDVNLTGGNATLQHNAQIIGDVTASGSITLEQHSEIQGDVSVEGDITLKQHTKITGTVCATGNITLENNVDIIGDIRVGGDITLGNNSKIKGNIWADGNINITFEQDANAQIIGNVCATGDITMTFDHPQAEIDGSVYATGSINPSESGHVTGTINPGEGCPFQPPGCLGIPPKAADIQTWEIM